MDKGKQFLQNQKLIDFDIYYDNFDIKGLISNIQQQIYTLTSALMKKRAKQGKVVIEFERLNPQQFYEKFVQMVAKIQTTVQSNPMKASYPFNDLYFLDNALIHKDFRLRDMLINDPKNAHLVIQILRAIFIISRKNAYVDIIQMIERSQATLITKNCMKIFSVEEIEEMGKKMSTIFAQQLSQAKYEMDDYFNGLAPILQMSKSKHDNVLRIISQSVREFINYVFIICDKTMLAFILDKTRMEINENEKMEGHDEILDNVCVLLDQYQKENPLTGKESNILDYDMKDSKGQVTKLKIDISGQEQLDKISSHILKHVNEKEKILEQFNNFTMQSIQNMQVFSEGQKMRMRLYLTFIFRPLKCLLDKILKEYTDQFIMEKIYSYVDDYISNVNLSKLICDTKKDLENISTQIKSQGKDGNDLIQQIVTKFKNNIEEKNDKK